MQYQASLLRRTVLYSHQESLPSGKEPHAANLIQKLIFFLCPLGNRRINGEELR